MEPAENQLWAWRWIPPVVGGLQVLLTTAASLRVTDRRPVDLLAIALLAAGPALLCVLPRWPVPVLIGNLVSTGLFYSLDYRFGPAFLGLATALIGAVVIGRRSAAWLVVTLGLPGYLVFSALLDRQQGPQPVAVVAVAAVLLLFLAIGEVLRISLERRAQTHRIGVAEHERRISQERLQVARDLHDVLAHHTSLVNVQANVALRLFERDPGQARASVAAIKEISAETLRDLRSALAVLRRDEDLPLRPAAGLDQLDELLARSAEAGLPVRQRVTGTPRRLSTAVDLAAFRIVQEAITNIRRHAQVAAATLVLGYEEAAVTLAVLNDGPQAGAAVIEGDGIGGMRERAASVGGSFEAGHRPDGGFRVFARLPERPEPGSRSGSS